MREFANVEPASSRPGPNKRDVAVARHSTAVVVQRKLLVGRADDPFEVEADRTADQVMRLLSTSPSPTDVVTPGLDSTRIRRMATTVDRLGGAEVDGDVAARIASRRGGGSPLEESTRMRLGSAFGADFGAVRVHTDGEADRLNRSLDAQAFTVGSDIFFRSDTRTSARSPNPLLAHELTHVVQQSGATAQRTIRRVTAPSDLVAADLAKAEADKIQLAARTTLKDVVDEGAASSERRLKNSCLMILQGKAKLFARTLTGDSAERVTGRGNSPSKEGAWFPQSTGDILSTPPTYNHLDLEDHTNIIFDDFSTLGSSGVAGVNVYDPVKQTKAQIFETIRHELQHAFDGSKEKKADAKSGTDPEAIQEARHKLERYKTEYRAYNYEGATATESKSPKKTIKRDGFTWTERQRHVFEAIYNGYAHTTEGWDNNLDLGGGKTFRKEVVKYVDPDKEGFNKYNSPKVDDLYHAVNACPGGAVETDNIVVEVINRIGLLDKADATAIVKENPEWVKHVKKKFSKKLATKVLDLLKKKAK